MLRKCWSYVVVPTLEEKVHGLYTDMKVVWSLFSSPQRVHAHLPRFLGSVPVSLHRDDSRSLNIIAVPSG